MLVKYKGWYDYQLSCGCFVRELYQARGNTSFCPHHGFQAFIVRWFKRGEE